jgi:hypothetical protein
MRTLVLGLAALVAAAVVAGGAAGSGGPLLVETEIPCIVGDADGGLWITFDAQLVIYGSGRAVLRCEASGLPNSSGRIANFNFRNTGELCSFGPFGETAWWNNKVSTLGTSQLVCTGHVDVSGPFDPAAARAAGFGLGR